MNIVVLLLLTLLQFISGIGVLALFNISLRNGLKIPLALLLGVAVSSFVPFLLQLLYVPLTGFSVFSALVMAALLLNLNMARTAQQWGAMFHNIRFTLKLYELPFILLITAIVFISVWRCYYLPPTPRDLTSGPEVLAEYAVREHTMINSVFNVDLDSTNNPYKPAFITSLQIIYKYAGFHFGQLWLGVIFVSFMLLLYQLLCEHLHRLLAGVLLLCFLAIPEMYAYTFMALFDYSNAVFFFLSVYCLTLYFGEPSRRYLYFAAWLMGIATYIRPETLVLAFFFIPLLVYRQWRSQTIRQLVQDAATFVTPALLLYAVSVVCYNSYYLPAQYEVSNLINPHPLQLRPFFDRFADMHTRLLFGSRGVSLYGYFTVLFVVLLLTEAAMYKLRFSFTARVWLYAVLVVYIGLPFLGYLLPLVDLQHSTKRGLLKIFPLMLLYLAHNQALAKLSARLGRWG
ncbi:MAG TPA: hypothetical protein VGE90_02435 [Chitinophaga sp.]